MVFCGVVYCSMGTFSKHLYPLYETVSYQWDNCFNLREVFLALFASVITSLLWYSLREYKIFSIIACVFTGICISDLTDKIHKYIDNKYQTDRITTEDIIIMLITVLLSLYQYGTRKDNRPIQSA